MPAPTMDFDLMPSHEAGEPPEERGLARDGVRLMVSYQAGDRIEHRRFPEIDGVLGPGDVLVINTSGTLKAALPAIREDGGIFAVHLSTRLPADLWIVEVRVPEGHSSRPYGLACAADVFHLPGGASVTLHAPYDHAHRARTGPLCGGRLWIASLALPSSWETYLETHGAPIRYAYALSPWPAAAYQTVYATEPGSAELPSAGRAFTTELITRLVSRGVSLLPLVLHTGVSSLEDHEPPYEEYYRVPLETAEALNAARRERRRIIAVGTTVVRALETVIDARGDLHPGEGWTRLVIGPERGIRAVTGLLTGLHEPKASHLAMLESLCGRKHLQQTYEQALHEGYLWHEFGDLHLIL